MTVATREPRPSDTWIRGEKARNLMFEIAIREKPYSQLAREYGMTTNAVCQFAWRNKDQIAKDRERFYAKWDAHVDHSKQWRIEVLKEAIEEMDQRMADLAELAEDLDMRICGGRVRGGIITRRGVGIGACSCS